MLLLTARVYYVVSLIQCCKCKNNWALFRIRVLNLEVFLWFLFYVRMLSKWWLFINLTLHDSNIHLLGPSHNFTLIKLHSHQFKRVINLRSLETLCYINYFFFSIFTNILFVFRTFFLGIMIFDLKIHSFSPKVHACWTLLVYYKPVLCINSRISIKQIKRFGCESLEPSLLIV